MQTKSQPDRFLLVSIIPHNLSKDEAFKNISELIALVESYGGEVVDIVLQKREVHDKGMYIGKGKIDEVSQLIAEKDIEVVVLNDIIRPGQIYDMQTIFEKVRVGVQVWDRVDLILKIFSNHANTAEAKLQIELAAMRHMGPRIYGMGEEMSRQGGMVGTRGIGETNTERMKRHWRVQMKKVKDDLAKLAKARENQMEQRSRTGLKTVSLVGYTNAGKSSLSNYLTGKERLVRDDLFVTLDTGIGKMKIGHFPFGVLVSDTIGFIRDLPPQLIDAFKSTLLESIHADLLIHVIDVSDPDVIRKIEVVEETLKSLKINDKKQLYVFNKTDVLSENNSEDGSMVSKEELIKRFGVFNPLFISVNKGQGIDELVSAISKHLV